MGGFIQLLVSYLAVRLDSVTGGRMKKSPLCLLLIVLALPQSFAQAPADAGTFALKDGDSVVFYGDSITEQRLYTRFIEEYVLTRFPDRKVTFMNSGVGGDRVSGGWPGPVACRLS